MRKRSEIVLAAIVLVSACRKPSPSPNVLMVPAHADSSPAASAGTASPGDVSIAGIAFRVPQRWQSQTPESPMRAAQFSIPGTANEKDASFAVYYFGKDQGGSVADNAHRWQGQFSGSGLDVSGLEKKTAGGLAVTIVRAAGTFASGMPMGPSTPEPNFALWGAIVEGPQGNIFLKATGPKATIGRAQGEFDALLATIHRAGASF